MAVTWTPGTPAQEHSRNLAALLVLVAIVAALVGLNGTISEPGESADVVEVISVEGFRQYRTLNSTETEYTYQFSGQTDGTTYVVEFETKKRLDIGDSVPVTIDDDNQTIRLASEPPAIPISSWWVAGISLTAAVAAATVGPRLLRWRQERTTARDEAPATKRPFGYWRIVLVAFTTIGPLFLTAQVRDLIYGPAVTATVVEADVLGVRSGVDVVFEVADGRRLEANVPFLAYNSNPLTMNVLPDTEPLIVQHGYAQGNDRIWMVVGFLIGVFLVSPLPTALLRRHRSQGRDNPLVS